MSWGGIKRDSLDADFSRAVRERAEWSCERCHRYFPVGERQSLQCSHVVGRRNKTVRFNPRNAFALCHNCHRYFTENPAEHIAWVTLQLGQTEYEFLRAESWREFKMTPDVKRFIGRRLKVINTEQQKLRALGVTGRIPFESPYPNPNDVLEPVKRKPRRKAKVRAAKRKLTHPTLKRKVNGQTVKRAA